MKCTQARKINENCLTSMKRRRRGEEQPQNEKERKLATWVCEKEKQRKARLTHFSRTGRKTKKIEEG
jgi:hypothetical protein